MDPAAGEGCDAVINLSGAGIGDKRWTSDYKRTLLAKDIYEQIQRVFGVKVFETVITKSVRLEESPAYRDSIFTFAPRSTGAYEYYRLSEEVLSRV